MLKQVNEILYSTEINTNLINGLILSSRKCFV